MGNIPEDDALQRILFEIKGAVESVAGRESRVILYGSRARGEDREDSDVDLMVVVPDGVADFYTKDRITDVILDIGNKYGLLAIPLVVSESQEKKFSGFKVFDSVEKEGVPV
ncbi:MAG: nucleotidyltransferase domain-containing protein [bacterium]